MVDIVDLMDQRDYTPVIIYDGTMGANPTRATLEGILTGDGRALPLTENFLFILEANNRSFEVRYTSVNDTFYTNTLSTA